MKDEASPAGSWRYDEAAALFKAGDWARARNVLGECVDLRPVHIGARFGLAMCHVKLGDDTSAESLLRALLADRADHLQAWRQLAWLLTRRGRGSEARAADEQIRRLLPGDAEAVRALSSSDAGRAREARPPADARPGTAGTSGRSPVATLADDLDDAGGEADRELAGRVVCRGRRSLLSHRRLWLAIVLLLYFPLAGLAKRGAEGIPGAGVLFAQLHGLGYAVVVISAILVVDALINSLASAYVVRERRLEITTGVLFRTRRFVWLYDIQELQYMRDPVLMLAGTAQIKIKLDETTPVTLKKSPRITGLGSAGFMQRLFDRLQPMVLKERRAMKKAFI